MDRKIFLLFLFLFFFLKSPVTALAAATLSFSPATKNVNLNESFNVDVVLTSGGAETDGADVIVQYDGNKLQVLSATLGDLYANKLTADTGTAGRITFRATSASDQRFNGTGVFATINFKAIAQGTANTFFDFTAGKTTDSNVASFGSDILGSTSGGSYTIGSSGVGGTSPAPSSAPSVPVSGTAEPTIFLLFLGLTLIGFGFAKLAFRF